MQIGALGDIHGAFDIVNEIMSRHREVPFWLSVGDVASNTGEYFTPVTPLYWIKGNNEDFDVIADAVAGRPPAPTLLYLPNGGPFKVGPWRVAALGGTYAPTWYHTPALALPASSSALLALAVAGSFLPDLAGIISGSFAASLLMAFAILGFAVLHAVTRGMTSRPFVLAAVYAAAALIGWPVLAVSILGLADTAFDIRGRIANKRGPPRLHT